MINWAKIWGSKENQWGFWKLFELPIFLSRDKEEYVFNGTQSAPKKQSQNLYIFILSEYQAKTNKWTVSENTHWWDSSGVMWSSYLPFPTLKKKPVIVDLLRDSMAYVKSCRWSSMNNTEYAHC